MDYSQEIANKMTPGLTTEKAKIKDMKRVMVEDEEDSRKIYYLMSIDEDFIPDVLQNYPR